MGPISVMESEHDDAGELVEVIKHITHNVTPPPEACTTRKAMYNGINEMIDDLMEHISPKTMCCSRVPSQVNKKAPESAFLKSEFGHCLCGLFVSDMTTLNAYPPYVSYR